MSDNESKLLATLEDHQLINQTLWAENRQQAEELVRLRKKVGELVSQKETTRQLTEIKMCELRTQLNRAETRNKNLVDTKERMENLEKVVSRQRDDLEWQNNVIRGALDTVSVLLLTGDSTASNGVLDERRGQLCFRLSESVDSWSAKFEIKGARFELITALRSVSRNDSLSREEIDALLDPYHVLDALRNRYAGGNPTVVDELYRVSRNNDSLRKKLGELAAAKQEDWRHHQTEKKSLTDTIAILRERLLMENAGSADDSTTTG